MGELVLAAKVTHVPSLMLSQHVESLKGTRDDAINALKLLGRRLRGHDLDAFARRVADHARALVADGPGGETAFDWSQVPLFPGAT